MNLTKTNSMEDNTFLNVLVANAADWHYEKDLIEGSTDLNQFDKLLEEVVELYLELVESKDSKIALMTLQNHLLNLFARGKGDRKEGNSVKDAIGDIIVVLTNIAERNNLTVEECLQEAVEVITKRKGKKVDGVFVKEEDL